MQGGKIKSPLKNYFFIYYHTKTMKNYTLWELLESPKAQDYMAENLDRWTDEEVIEAILELNYWHYNTEKKETFYTMDDLENAVADTEKLTIFKTMDDYYDYCDDLLSFADSNSVEARYFDYDAYHRDCEYDVTEASNGVVIADW